MTPSLNAILVLIVFAFSTHFAFAEPVVWTDLKDVVVHGDTITKNTRESWLSSAKSSHAITNGIGSFEFSVDQSTILVLRFNDGSMNGEYVTSGHTAILLSASSKYSIFFDASGGFSGVYSAGDRFRVEFDLEATKWFQNNELIFTNRGAVPNLLFANFVPFRSFASISDAVMVDGIKKSALDPSLKNSMSSMNDVFGDIFGMPIVFLILVFIASIFTPKNSHIGILILGFLLAIMIAFELITISAEVFGLIVVIIALGLFVGRKRS